MNMNKRDLKKLTKSRLIKLLIKQKQSKKVRNHEDLLDNDPFKDEVSQPIALPQKPTRQQSEPVVQQAPIQIRIKLPKPNRPPPPPPMKEHIIDVPSSKIKELN